MYAGFGAGSLAEIGQGSSRIKADSNKEVRRMAECNS